MKFKPTTKQRIYAPVVAAVLVIVVVGAMSLNYLSDSHSRTQAIAAASTYTKAAHSYLNTAITDLTNAGSDSTNDDQAYNLIVQLNKVPVPKLKQVSGAGAKSAAYKAAVAYQAKVAAFLTAMNKNDAAVIAYHPYIHAYDELRGVQTAISGGALSSGDAVTAIKNAIMNPITSDQTAFKKVKVTSEYTTAAADINAAFTEYINDGNQLIAAAQNGTSSPSFTYPSLDAIYNDIAIGDTLNATDLSLATQAQSLIKQS